MCGVRTRQVGDRDVRSAIHRRVAGVRQHAIADGPLHWFVAHVACQRRCTLHAHPPWLRATGDHQRVSKLGLEVPVVVVQGA